MRKPPASAGGFFIFKKNCNSVKLNNNPKVYLKNQKLCNV